MKISKLVLSALAAMSITAITPANAALMQFNVDDAYDGIHGSFILTTAGIVTAAGTLVTGITGTIFGSTVASLDAVNTFNGNDNFVYSDKPFVDYAGISFALADGDQVNIWSDIAPSTTNHHAAGYVYDTVHYSCTSTDDTCGDGNGFDVTIGLKNVVPEPGSVALVGLGLLGLFATMRRRNSI